MPACGHRLLAAVAAAGVALLAGASPAGADPAQPTDYRSTIDAVEPDVDGVRVAVVGGDAFLEVDVEPGHEVVVEGYEGEPYVRILADGTVEQNDRSPASFLNADRYARSAAPAGLDADADPEWRVVDDDGGFTWHDHRVHWMSPDTKPGVEPGEVVQDWVVPMTVDGTAVEVRGTLVLEAAENPLPWIGIGVAAVVAALVAGWRRHGLTVAAAATVVGGVGAVLTAWAQYTDVPDGAGAPLAVIVVPAVGLGFAAVAVLGTVLRARALTALSVLAAAAALGGWAVVRLAVLVHPVLPTSLAPGLDRSATTVAVGLALAAAVLAVRSGALAPAELADEGEDVDDGAVGPGGEA